ncbi:MAG: 16S rRNA (cytidine(1402)-2'-O)-methyltransferase [Pseudomonadota bacterium]
MVATPIGNLADLSARARSVLSEVALIAAEDTRHTSRLLSHFGIHTPQMALHDHNESTALTNILRRLELGEDVAVVSDAGTPLISDPGFRLVRAAIAAGVDPVAVPGPSAVTAALSIAGLPVDQFTFVGFIPSRDEARQRFVAELVEERRTVVAFESVHRIAATLAAFADVLPPERQLSVHREMTKQFESTYRGSAADLAAAAAAGEIVMKGEFVLVIAGSADQAVERHAVDTDSLLGVLLDELPVKAAVAAAQRLTGAPRNRLYQRALALTRER